jgi:hypothetical protein
MARMLQKCNQIRHGGIGDWVYQRNPRMASPIFNKERIGTCIGLWWA